MASMIGIGVAVDYSLFIVSRFRRELHEGAARDEALERAMRSSGTAVVFSGAAVAVSLAALFAIDVNALRSMARRRDRRRLHLDARLDHAAAGAARGGRHARRPAAASRCRGGRPRQGSDAFWNGWARRVMRRPAHRARRRRRRDARARDSLLLDADVQPRARRAAAERGGARRDRACAGAHRPRLRRARCTCSRRRPHASRAKLAAIPGVARVAAPVPSADAARAG